MASTVQSPRHLSDLQGQVEREVRLLLPRNFTERLRGTPPDGWSQTPEWTERLVRGLAFYTIEDFLFPEGLKGTPNPNVSLGRKRRPDGEIPPLCRLLEKLDHPGPQPLALRTFDDAEKYAAAGRLKGQRKRGTDRFASEVDSPVGTHFKFFDHLWFVRFKSEIDPVYHEQWLSIQRFGGSLFYHGRAPSWMVANKLGPEIRFVVGSPDPARTVSSGESSSWLTVPDPRFQAAFRRYVKHLEGQWKQEEKSDPGSSPSIDWVQDKLGIQGEDDKSRRFLQAMECYPQKG